MAVNNQGIQDFYYQAQTRGFARDFQFRITQFKVNDGIILSPADLVFLKTANVPSKTITTVQAPFMGLDFQIPGTVKFDGNANWPVKFYCSQDYNIRNTLESAMYDTFDHQTSTGRAMTPRDLRGNIIEMALVDDQLNPIRTYTLYGAFVTKIEDIGYDLTKNGGIQEVGASIAYQYWESTPTTGIAVGIDIRGIGGVGGVIGGAVSSIANSVVRIVTNKTVSKILKGLGGG
jgi:hypothetical protein